MSNKKTPARMNVAVKPIQSSQAEALKKVEKKAFVACVLGIAGAPLAFIGLGIIPGIIALVLGIKAVRPNGKRPAGAIVGIPGCIIFYGTYINPNSAFVQKLVDMVVKAANLIL